MYCGTIELVKELILKQKRRLKKMDGNKLVTTKEMASILSVHENTLFNWAKEGMPRYKLGSNAVRYDVEEVLEWVRTRGEEKRENKNV